MEGAESSAGPSRNLTITALGARSKQYIKSLTIDGVAMTEPIIRHEQIANGGDVVFEMSDEIEAWGNDPDLLAVFAPGRNVGTVENGDANNPQVSMPLRGSGHEISNDAIRDEL